MELEKQIAAKVINELAVAVPDWQIPEIDVVQVRKQSGLDACRLAKGFAVEWLIKTGKIGAEQRQQALSDDHKTGLLTGAVGDAYENAYNKVIDPFLLVAFEARFRQDCIASSTTVWYYGHGDGQIRRRRR
jgi:hypothetical protein